MNKLLTPIFLCIEKLEPVHTAHGDRAGLDLVPSTAREIFGCAGYSRRDGSGIGLSVRNEPMKVG